MKPITAANGGEYGYRANPTDVADQVHMHVQTHPKTGSHPPPSVYPTDRHAHTITAPIRMVRVRIRVRVRLRVRVRVRVRLGVLGFEA